MAEYVWVDAHGETRSKSRVSPFDFPFFFRQNATSRTPSLERDPSFLPTATGTHGVIVQQGFNQSSLGNLLLDWRPMCTVSGGAVLSRLPKPALRYAMPMAGTRGRHRTSPDPAPGPRGLRRYEASPQVVRSAKPRINRRPRPPPTKDTKMRMERGACATLVRGSSRPTCDLAGSPTQCQ
jgi:hypothetical protein